MGWVFIYFKIFVWVFIELKEDSLKVTARTKIFYMNAQAQFGNEDFSSNNVGIVQHHNIIEQLNHNIQNVSYFKTLDFILRLINMVSNFDFEVIFLIYINF
jgi:hypothetical protein